MCTPLSSVPSPYANIARFLVASTTPVLHNHVVFLFGLSLGLAFVISGCCLLSRLHPTPPVEICGGRWIASSPWAFPRGVTFVYTQR